MTVYYPEATPVQGNRKVVAATTVANAAAPSLASEINAATSVDLSLTIRDWNPQVTVNSGQAPPRLGTKQQMPQEGRAQYAAIEIRYPYDPQADDTDPNNEAKALLAEGTELAFITFDGVDAEGTVAVGDQSVTWEVRCGRQTRTRSGDDEFAEFEISQMLYPVRPETDGVVAA